MKGKGTGALFGFFRLHGLKTVFAKFEEDDVSVLPRNDGSDVLFRSFTAMDTPDDEDLGVGFGVAEGEGGAGEGERWRRRGGRMVGVGEEGTAGERGRVCAGIGGAGDSAGVVTREGREAVEGCVFVLICV